MKNKLTNNQLTVINSIISDIEKSVNEKNIDDKFIELNGPAGVGKTFLTTVLINHLVNNDYKVALTAPTHSAISSINKISQSINKKIYLGTIHSFLNLKIENDYKTGNKILSINTDEKIEKVDVLIIDEKSMVCEKLLYLIRLAIRKGSLKSVILVGDGYQLKCVNDNSINKFNNYHELTEIVRQQKDSYIIKLATDIRDNIEKQSESINIKEVLTKYYKNIKIYTNEEDFLNHYYNIKGSEEQKVIGAYQNKIVNYYNNKIMKYLHPNSNYVENGYSFVLQENNFIYKDNQWTNTHNNGERITIVNVQKVIQGTKFNAFDNQHYQEYIDFQNYIKKSLNYINDYFGIDMKVPVYYECIDNNNKKILILDEKNHEYIEKISDMIKKEALCEQEETRKKLFKMYFNLNKLFANVKYSHASTYHKLQGSTFEHIGIDVRSLQTYEKDSKRIDDILRLFYVGVTRASKDVFVLVKGDVKSQILDF